MRIAALIVGLVIGFAVLFQACAVYGLSGIAQGLGDAESAQRVRGSAAGMLTGLLILVGAGFVMPFPRMAGVIFAAAGLLGLAVNATTDFGDQAVWGIVAFGLAGLAFFGARSKRREDLQRAEERAALLSLRAPEVAPPAAESRRSAAEARLDLTKVCPDCAETVKADAKICRYCRHDFTQDEPAAHRPVAGLSPDVVDQLDDLLALRDNGEISAEEHERRANQILRGGSGSEEKIDTES